jgi:hypothetical protein
VLSCAVGLLPSPHSHQPVVCGDVVCTHCCNAPSRLSCSAAADHSAAQCHHSCAFDWACACAGAAASSGPVVKGFPVGHITDGVTKGIWIHPGLSRYSFACLLLRIHVVYVCARVRAYLRVCLRARSVRVRACASARVCGCVLVRARERTSGCVATVDNISSHPCFSHAGPRRARASCCSWTPRDSALQAISRPPTRSSASLPPCSPPHSSTTLWTRSTW